MVLRLADAAALPNRGKWNAFRQHLQNLSVVYSVFQFPDSHRVVLHTQTLRRHEVELAVQSLEALGR